MVSKPILRSVTYILYTLWYLHGNPNWNHPSVALLMVDRCDEVYLVGDVKHMVKECRSVRMSGHTKPLHRCQSQVDVLSQLDS